MNNFTTLWCGCLLCGMLGSVSGQQLAGQWTGSLESGDGTAPFRYELQLTQQGEAVSGFSVSQSADGALTARFEISGRWTGQELVLQEIRQVSPSSPQWCLKFATLRFADDGELAGGWTATGCRPGQLRLRRAGASPPAPAAGTTAVYPGRWTGHLHQTDRDYGFYYEISLLPNGEGTSHLVSEGGGGEVTHALRWTAANDILTLTEYEIIARTDPQWRWCLKTLQLRQTNSADRHHLEGNWEGYLEGHSPTTGACAPGGIVLEKPIVSQAAEAEIQPVTSAYTTETSRTVKVDRVIQVSRPNVTLFAWDNGTVDGDKITLFLNGRRILNNYRVAKQKWSMPIEISSGENLLIMHADDLGGISPCTVAVSIYDGIQEQVIVLSSNLRESGAILIQPFSME